MVMMLQLAINSYKIVGILSRPMMKYFHFVNKSICISIFAGFVRFQQLLPNLTGLNPTFFFINLYICICKLISNVFVFQFLQDLQQLSSVSFRVVPQPSKPFVSKTFLHYFVSKKSLHLLPINFYTNSIMLNIRSFLSYSSS